MTQKDKVYNPTIDFIRLISILAVIMIHTTTRTLGQSGNNLAAFPFSLILNQISRFAVPLFFLISGYVLELNYSFHANYFSYLKKRLNRIFIPYVFWSAIYFYLIYLNHTNTFINALTYGSASYQLYFIPTLIIFYLIFPIFHYLYKIIANQWVVLILFGLQLFILYSDYFLHNITFSYPVSIALFNFFVFIVGIIASHHQLNQKNYFLVIASAIYVAAEGYVRFYQTGNYLSFYSQWRPSILVYTLALFFVLYQIKINSNLIKTLSQLSFFVFFVHIMVLENVWNLIGKFYAFPGFDILYFVLVAGISFLMAFLVHKITKLKLITG